jgi:hypothetical protein
MALVAMIAATPVVMLWLALLRMTGHGLRVFAEVILEWPIRRDQVGPTLGPPDGHGGVVASDDRTGVVKQFLRWFRALALSYLAILGVYVIGRGMMAATLLQVLQAPVPWKRSAYVPTTTTGVASSASLRIKPVDRADLIEEFLKLAVDAPRGKPLRERRQALRDSLREKYAKAIGIGVDELNEGEQQDIDVLVDAALSSTSQHPPPDTPKLIHEQRQSETGVEPPQSPDVSKPSGGEKAAKKGAAPN